MAWHATCDQPFSGLLQSSLPDNYEQLHSSSPGQRIISKAGAKLFCGILSLPG
jgi:hypothetical protein